MKKPFGPYSQVKKAGNFYYVSGQVGVQPGEKFGQRGIEYQAAQALKNLVSALESKNLTTADVVKTTLYLTDIGYYDAVNKIYETFFDPPRPARAAMSVEELPRVVKNCDLLIEIDAIAYKEDTQ